MSSRRKSKANPKFLFWSLLMLIMLVTQIILSIGLISVAILLHRWFGIVLKVSGLFEVFGGMAFLIAFVSVGAIGRRVGFVEPCRTETLRRSPGPLPVASFETLELRTPEALRKQMMIACPVIGCLIALLALIVAINHGQIYNFAVSGVFFALGLLPFWLGKSEDFNFVARIDRDGVVAYQGFRKHAAAWQEIEAVKIEALSGAPGAPVTRTYALFGQGAKRLFFFNLLYVPPVEQEKFERVLREAFEAQPNLSEMTV